jgi:tryptophan-rich sensory protein
MTTVAQPMLWRAILVAALAALAVAAIGGTLTDLGPWYQSLREPAWKPPDAAFGAIWTTIFALAAMSGVLAWRGDRTAAGRQWTIGLFATNGFLNVLWSLVFFRLHRPDFALVEVGALWLSIFVLIVVLFRKSVWASVLLVPYLVWVSTAAVLNYEVVRLNGPFA